MVAQQIAWMVNTSMCRPEEAFVASDFMPCKWNEQKKEKRRAGKKRITAKRHENIEDTVRAFFERKKKNDKPDQ